MAPRRQHWSLFLVMIMALGAALALPDNNYQALAHHQVWVTEGRDAMKIVAGLEAEGLADILGHTSSSPKFRVAPDSRTLVSDALAQVGINYKVLIHDLASHVKEEQRASLDILRSAPAESCTEDSCPEPLTTSYMTFEQIEWYLKELSKKSPRVKLDSIGTSVEGRNIWRVHIKPTPTDEPTTTTLSVEEGRRNAVWLEGGLHAREWISPAVSLHLIQKIVADKTITQKLDMYVVPMANPDGYVYSWTTNRLWRKNRRPNQQQLRCSQGCCGVDLNRNWNISYGVGASSNPCSEVYMGTEPFSEPETKALSEDMLSVASGNNLLLVLSLHSYSQVLLYPWGYSANPAPHTTLMKRAGQLFAKAARKQYNTTYTVLNTAAEYYAASGATDDWAKGVLETPFVYTLELRDTGSNGFVLPSEMIMSNSNEVWDGARNMLSFINKHKL